MPLRNTLRYKDKLKIKQNIFYAKNAPGLFPTNVSLQNYYCAPLVKFPKFIIYIRNVWHN